MLTRTHGQHIHRATDEILPNIVHMQPLKERSPENRQVSKDSFKINPKTFEYPLQKAEIGADRQKIILAPIEVTSAELEGWRSRSLHAQILAPSAIGRSGPSRSTNLQPLHGRVDSTAKYGGYR
ncbi:hypothetical protein GOODEAATRI_026953 [Goodea atripinnis]|uniref:Uncharacterized protein n=1 Tax=Goodea atripinnis TaxID=208336 RepID=A0ABV0Q1W5_9TELE